MKTHRFYLLSSLFCMLIAYSGLAQEPEKRTDNPSAVAADEGPIMYKFELDFLDRNEKRRAEIARTRSIIDTLAVSERKRQKLLRDLYKNGISKRLQKALLVESTFEEID